MSSAAIRRRTCPALGTLFALDAPMLDSPATQRAEMTRSPDPHQSLAQFDRLFRFIVWNWNVPTNRDEPAELVAVAELFDKLVGLGTRLAVVTKNNTDRLSFLIETVKPQHRRKLFIVADDGAVVLGFDHRGTAVALSMHEFPNRSTALKHILDREIHPLGIPPKDMLLLEHSFGSTNNSDDDDELDLLPQCHGAVTSQKCELARIERILRRQTALDERLGSFAPPRDAAWVILESGFDMTREHEIESLLAIANGYVGVRGSIAEGSDVSRPATFLAGAFERSSDVYPVPELVIAPDWGRLRFTIEGEPFMASSTTVREHHRALDMRRGVLLREGLVTGTGGHTTEIRTLHVASMANRHLLIEAIEIIPKNYSGTVTIDAILSGDVKSESGGAHWNHFEPRSHRHGPMLIGTTHGGLRLALASHTTSFDPGIMELNCKREMSATWATERCELHVRLGEPTALHRVVALYTSRDEGDPVARAEALTDKLAHTSCPEVLSKHEAAWMYRWKRANVEIDGAPKIERALRFASYHLLSSVHPTDPRTSVGARALSGEAYRGHVFWDTEIFMQPLYVHTWPEAARTLLQYRHRTLDGARRKAQRLDYRGALYAWESADTGDETTPEMVLTPYGEIIPILSGVEEQHISADVAYAVWSYVRATNDIEFLRTEGAEILLETARFWASRVQAKNDGHFHIDRVIGPDEYHESIDDNAFTNWMARKNLRVAAMVARGEGKDVASTLGIDPQEIARWEHIASRMYLGLDEHTHVIEQHRGFFELEYVDLQEYTPRTAPMDVLLGRQRTQASQVVKQADVVQLIALLWDEIEPRVRRKSFLYYEPRTAHGSSLSPGIHALVAARLGLVDLAERYLEQTADIDLGNNMGNAAGGVHAAGMGSLWQAVVFGVAGLRQDANDPEVLFVEPNLLPTMRRVSLPFTIRGTMLELHISHQAIEMSVEDGPAPIEVAVPGSSGTHQRVRAEPGRSYVTKHAKDGFSAWEETSQ
ncbi:MAG: glycoside hydrolase family 65 protein [Polyangiaceae bacterium]|nr:glycoside hydrolase family 65 protein [Polyangiaceae bacterium]